MQNQTGSSELAACCSESSPRTIQTPIPSLNFPRRLKIISQVLCLPLLLLGLPLPSHPLPQFLLRPNSIFPPASSFSSHFPPLVYPSSTSPLLYQAPASQSNPGLLYQAPGSNSNPGLLYQAGPISASPRARCSSCDCSADFGCSYNCDKCPALCKVRQTPLKVSLDRIL